MSRSEWPPLAAEGRSRLHRTAEGVRSLSQLCEATVVVPIQGAIDEPGCNVPYRRVLSRVDGVVATGVYAVTHLAGQAGTSLVRVDFADVRAVLARRGRGVLGLGVLGLGAASGPDRAVVATRRALASPCLRGFDLSRAEGLLLVIEAAEPDLAEMWQVAHAVHDAVGAETLIVYADAREEELGDTLHLTMLAAGQRDITEGSGAH